MWLNVFEMSDRSSTFDCVRFEAFTAAGFICQTAWCHLPEYNNVRELS